MKYIQTLAVLSTLVSPLAFSQPFPNFKLDAKDVIRIEIGTEEDEDAPRESTQQVSYLLSSNRELRRRVRRLEQALRQMQDQIYRLEGSSFHQVAQMQLPREYTCYINTAFQGTVYGKGTSEFEARARALQSCDEKHGGLSCSDRHVKCGS